MTFEYNQNCCPLFWNVPSQSVIRHFDQQYPNLVQRYIKRAQQDGEKMDPQAIFDVDLGITVGETALLIVGNYQPSEVPNIPPPKLQPRHNKKVKKMDSPQLTPTQCKKRCDKIKTESV